MPSFDVVSELDTHEVTNAMDNAAKELERRYDLRGKASLEFKDKTITLIAEADFMLNQVIEIVKLALVKRKVDIQCLEYKDPYASGKVVKQELILREGIDKEWAKERIATMNEAKLNILTSHNAKQYISHWYQ